MNTAAPAYVVAISKIAADSRNEDGAGDEVDPDSRCRPDAIEGRARNRADDQAGYDCSERQPSGQLGRRKPRQDKKNQRQDEHPSGKAREGRCDEQRRQTRDVEQGAIGIVLFHGDPRVAPVAAILWSGSGRACGWR
ncbi:hypothetical protein [Burkholderia ubonensis]|uniref:hypothetical protein n=1 Tax=Burkholderia ubonensis TaxID=101571 RepID=UPI0012FDFCDD|nr:hypothetical protein [Burkholderia ubonensis]